MLKFGMCFSRDFEGNNPLSHIGRKLPVYLRLLELCQKEGWEVYVLTRKTYKGSGTFNGAWLFKNLPAGRQGGKFEKKNAPVKIDLIFDWVGNLKFPPANEPNLKTVNVRAFKEITCDKWKMYQLLGDFMPKTFWVGKRENINRVLPKIKTDWVVVKPVDGLKGKGIFVGPKEGVKSFEFDPKFQNYIVQEFVDTSHGIPGLTPGLHDLRVVVINKKPVWCHVRVPQQGTYKANVGQGGTLTEIDFNQVPGKVKEIVVKIAPEFYAEFDNPVYSLDFGIDRDGTPFIFEINDQMGFPRWEMKNRDSFLKALVSNFYEKI